jgi:hypothetical protein
LAIIIETSLAADAPNLMPSMPVSTVSSTGSSSNCYIVGRNGLAAF